MPDSPRSSQRRLRFGAFELDARTGELRKAGARVRLAGQPLRLLERLIDRPGDLVTREELRRELWSDDTFVDFERNLNSAIKRLRATLHDSAEAPRFIETLPKRGYRFLMPVEHVPETAIAADNLPSSNHSNDVPPPRTLDNAVEKVSALAPLVSRVEGPRRERRSHGRRLVAAAALVVVGLVAVLSGMWRERPRGFHAIAVLPFVSADAGSEEDRYIAFGLTEALTTELSKLPAVRVLSRASSLQYTRTGKGLPQIAKELRVDAVVEGSVQREGSHIRIAVQLVEAVSDTHVWAESYERDTGNVLRVLDEVAVAAARQIQVRVDPGSAPQSRRPRPMDPRISHAYLQGRYHLVKGTDAGFARARSFFEQSLAIDSTHAPSHSGLADAYILSESLAPEVSFRNAKIHALRALELDETLPDAHASLAFVHHFGDWDWGGAERQFTRAVELGPDHMRSRRWYGIFLSAMGRHAEAMDQIQLALAVDPIAMINLDAAAGIRFNARQYVESAAIGRNMVDLDEFDPRGYEHLTLGLIQLEQYSDALARVEKGLEFSRSNIVLKLLKVLCLGRLGRTAQAEHELSELEREADRPSVSAACLGIARADLGDHARALDHLERAHKRHDPYLVLLHTSPWFDALRTEPRFGRLYAQMKFPR